MSESYKDHIAEAGRLTILRCLHEQNDNRLNESVLASMLDDYGFNQSREWLRTQLNKLKELGAVEITLAGNVMIATLKRAGLDHVERRSFIEGVKQPSLET